VVELAVVLSVDFRKLLQLCHVCFHLMSPRAELAAVLLTSLTEGLPLRLGCGRGWTDGALDRFLRLGRRLGACSRPARRGPFFAAELVREHRPENSQKLPGCLACGESRPVRHRGGHRADHQIGNHKLHKRVVVRVQAREVDRNRQLPRVQVVAGTKDRVAHVHQRNRLKQRWGRIGERASLDNQSGGGLDGEHLPRRQSVMRKRNK
jgi:hypothetical protein